MHNRKPEELVRPRSQIIGSGEVVTLSRTADCYVLRFEVMFHSSRSAVGIAVIIRMAWRHDWGEAAAWSNHGGRPSIRLKVTMHGVCFVSTLDSIRWCRADAHYQPKLYDLPNYRTFDILSYRHFSRQNITDECEFRFSFKKISILPNTIWEMSTPSNWRNLDQCQIVFGTLNCTAGNNV